MSWTCSFEKHEFSLSFVPGAFLTAFSTVIAFGMNFIALSSDQYSALKPLKVGLDEYLYASFQAALTAFAAGRSSHRSTSKSK